MQTHTPHRPPAPSRSPIGRLIRWYQIRVIRAQITELSLQLDTLQQHMTIDQLLTERSHGLYLKSPTLAKRMQADATVEQALITHIENLRRALATLEAQP